MRFAAFAARAAKKRSRACALCAFFLRHSFVALQTFGLLIRATKPSHTAKTLSAMPPKLG